MALQEAAVYREEITHIYLHNQEEEDFYTVTRQGQFNWMNLDAQDTFWFSIAKESNLWMQEEEEEYMKSRDPVTSFPTPKLGAKSRTC